jgi:hypothetical protein
MFWKTNRLFLQGWRINQAENQHEADLATCFELVSSLAYSSTLNIGVSCSSKMSTDFQQTTWHYILEDHHCDNLKSSTLFVSVFHQFILEILKVKYYHIIMCKIFLYKKYKISLQIWSSVVLHMNLSPPGLINGPPLWSSDQSS